MKRQTGKEWAEEYKKEFRILDADGWQPRQGLNNVLITNEEFLRRVNRSTCQYFVNPSEVKVRYETI